MTSNIYLSSVPDPSDLVPHCQPCMEELDGTAKTTVTVVQGQFEDTVTRVEKVEVQMPSKVTVELACQVRSCNFDGHGNKFKIPPLSQHEALQLLKIHRAMDRGLRGAVVASDHDVQVDAVPETVCKPALLRGCSVEQFQSFQVDKDT